MKTTTTVNHCSLIIIIIEQWAGRYTFCLLSNEELFEIVIFILFSFPGSFTKDTFSRVVVQSHKLHFQLGILSSKCRTFMFYSKIYKCLLCFHVLVPSGQKLKLLLYHRCKWCLCFVKVIHVTYNYRIFSYTSLKK